MPQTAQNLRSCRTCVDGSTVHRCEPCRSCTAWSNYRNLDEIAQRATEQAPQIGQPAPMPPTNPDNTVIQESGEDEENTITCDHCNSEVPEDETATCNGEKLCQDCQSGTTVCDECGERYDNDEILYVDSSDRNVCEVCLRDEYFRCSDCEEYHLSDYSVYVSGVGYICEGCRDSGPYMSCEDCGETRHEDNFYQGDDDRWYCSGCIDDHRLRSIQCYSYRPELNFIHEKEEEYSSMAYGDKISRKGPKEYFGVELEVAQGRSCVVGRNEAADNAIGDNEDKLYCKEDSSVDFEVVSHPFTRKAFYGQMYDVWQNALASLRSDRYASHQAQCSCGMHIHVSRTAITSGVLYKLLKLVYNFPRLSWKISQRKDQHLRHWATVYDSTSQALKAKEKRGFERYNAINLQPPSTIEFRLFRGTLKFSRFVKNMQFVFAALDYCRVTGFSRISAGGFTEFVNNAGNEYGELKRFMAKMSV